MFDSPELAQQAARATVVAVIATIYDMGAEGAPSGVMYAALAGRVTYDQYTAMIQVLKDRGLVRESNNVLYWNGPAV